MHDIIVVKFGGTSVKDSDHIMNAANKVKLEIERGNMVAVVVSAKAGVTNDLLRQFEEVAGGANLTDELMAEKDAVLAVGEQINAGLFATALQKIGLNSRSFQGWQIPLRVTGHHGAVVTQSVDVNNMYELMSASEMIVPVIAGFQGVNSKNRVSTFERGGSDLTAVELAIALKAKRCDIYTDVDGVYTADPNIVEGAKAYGNVFYGDMLDMAQSGAKVLDKTCVEKAQRHGVLLQVLSTAPEEPIGSDLSGTMISGEATVLKYNNLSDVPKLTTTVNVPRFDYVCV